MVINFNLVFKSSSKAIFSLKPVFFLKITIIVNLNNYLNKQNLNGIEQSRYVHTGQ